MIDPSVIFDINSNDWKKFEELIEIRHSFNHAVEVRTRQEARKEAPKLWLVNNQFPENIWPINKVERDHRVLNFKSASNLSEVIDWAMDRLTNAFPEKLNNSYMTEETIQLID